MYSGSKVPAPTALGWSNIFRCPPASYFLIKILPRPVVSESARLKHCGWQVACMRFRKAFWLRVAKLAASGSKATTAQPWLAAYIAKMPVLAPMSKRTPPSGMLSMKSNNSGSMYSWPRSCHSKRRDDATKRKCLPRNSVSTVESKPSIVTVLAYWTGPARACRSTRGAVLELFMSLWRWQNAGSRHLSGSDIGIGLR